MKPVHSWRTVLFHVPVVLLIAVPGAASAQLVVGGEAFEPSDSSSDVSSDDLTQAHDYLRALGYDTGPIGTENQKLTVAITTFQLRNEIEPADGLVSPVLLLALRVAANAQGNAVAASGSASAGAAASSLAASEAATEDDPCLQDELREVASSSRNTGRRLGAFGRLLNRAGVDSDVVQDAGSITRDVAGAANDGRVLAGDCNR